MYHYIKAEHINADTLKLSVNLAPYNMPPRIRTGIIRRITNGSFEGVRASGRASVFHTDQTFVRNEATAFWKAVKFALVGAAHSFTPDSAKHFD